ncbi:unnamed protein product [Paramecium sonneborni]|uniref:Uncharacterized protein n=1 Tax=Paramecium sonneborni TaxID=65129 RepID=A0A8S1RUN5_9CILI|nr:unnamed protein product [Paramecium sonneborni]
MFEFQTGISDMTQQLLQQSPLYNLKLSSILVQISSDVVNLIKPHIPKLFKLFEQTIESLKKTDNTTMSYYFFFFDSTSNVTELEEFQIMILKISLQNNSYQQQLSQGQAIQSSNAR